MTRSGYKDKWYWFHANERLTIKGETSGSTLQRSTQAQAPSGGPEPEVS